MSVHQAAESSFAEVALLSKITFWNPLPITNGLSSESERLIRESNADITAARLESALDGSLALNAVAPNYVPGFIRTTELLFATRRMDQARKLTHTLSRHEALQGDAAFALALAKVLAHIDPSAENILRIASRILDEDSRRLLTPYVPAAIDILASDGRGEEALNLAISWADKARGDALANAYLVREHLRCGSADEAEQTIRQLRGQYDLDRSWPENVIASGIIAISRSDDPTIWQALVPGCQALRAKSLDYAKVHALLEFLVPALDDYRRALIAAGLYSLNAGDMNEARALLETINPNGAVERYLVGVGLSRVAASTDDRQLHTSSLSDAFEALQDEQVASFAATSEIIEPPAPITTVGLDLADALRRNEAYPEAIEILSQLRGRGHVDAAVDRLHAEIVGQSGSRSEALEELNRLLKRHEAEGQLRATIQTLESMLRLSPGNLTLRNRLVDKYLRTGQFDEAINQLVFQARLLHRANRTNDALPPMHRAIEIATMVGEWRKVEHLHRLMISFDPHDTAIRHSAVATYIQHGRTDAALDQLREIVRIARERNDPDEAIAASHQMLALAPDEPSTYHQLGELLLSIEEYGQAERVYKRLAALTPDDPAITAKRSAIAAMARNRQ
jgi:tetratricopeptide (TPR) repeat protein